MGEIPYQQGRAMKSSDPQPSTNHLINCPGASCRGALPFCASSYCMLTHWKERHGGEEMPQWLEKEIAISSSERKAVLQWGARSSAMSRKRKAAEDKAAEATLAAKRARASEAEAAEQQAGLGRGQRGLARAAAAATPADGQEEVSKG